MSTKLEKGGATYIDNKHYNIKRIFNITYGMISISQGERTMIKGLKALDSIKKKGCCND